MPLNTSWLLPDSDEPSTRVRDSLSNELLNPCVVELNEVRLRRRSPVFPDDQLPTNQRNLTDVRTRIGLLIEFELGQSIDSMLKNAFGGDVRLAYVVANRFPDLEIRRQDGETGLRLEVKTLDVLAEEKAANFDTLIKDIRPGTDYIAVLLWEWRRDEVALAQYPHIVQYFVLNAFELALMRDNYWLNHPPKNIGENRQGFDIRWAVNANASGFNREEGNYGKLMRISDSDSLQWLADTRTPLKTPAYYFDMCDKILDAGFVAVAENILNAITPSTNGKSRVPSHFVDPNVIRYSLVAEGREIDLICSRTRMPSETILREAASRYAEIVIAMNPKFGWVVHDGGTFVRLKRGRKPNQLIDFLQGHMA